MEDIKVQLTKENIEYKYKIGFSFAKIINTMFDIIKSNSSIELEMIQRIKNEINKK